MELSRRLQEDPASQVKVDRQVYQGLIEVGIYAERVRLSPKSLLPVTSPVQSELNEVLDRLQSVLPGPPERSL